MRFQCASPRAAFLCAALIVTSTPRGEASEVRPVLVRAYDPAVPRERMFFVGNSANAEDGMALRDRLTAAGARNVNLIVSENVVVADVVGDHGLSGVDIPASFRFESFSDLTPDYVAGVAPALGWIVDAYRAADELAHNSLRAGNLPPQFREQVITISRERADAIQRELDAAHFRRGHASILAPDRGLHQDSEILGGSILATFILPESENVPTSGINEDWTDQEILAVKRGALLAMLSWQGNWPNMDIGVTISFGPQDAFVRVPIPYEPIRNGPGVPREDPWINAVLIALGYEDFIASDELVGLHAFNQAQRALRRTQWAFTGVIACSRNTPNHWWGGGEIGYTGVAYFGGPSFRAPYPAGPDPNDIGEELVFSQIIQHEATHCFWAVDEYPSLGGRCADRFGYLNYANGNLTNVDLDGNEFRCNPYQACIMYGAKNDEGRPYCRWSDGHVGASDDNSNGMPDAFESAPEIEFGVGDVETVLTNEFTLRCRVTATAVPNRNGWFRPENRIDYAAPLESATLVVGERRIELDALDGDWGEVEEDCEFSVELSTAGLNVFVVEAENSVGFKSGRRSKQVYFVGVNYSRTGLSVKPHRIDVTWEVVGDPFGATFDVYRLASGEELPGALIAENVEAEGPGSGGFVPYRYIDRDITPGKDYRYYVKGSFSLPFEGGTRDYSSQSQIVGQTAMIPVVEGEIMSAVAPNPSRGTVMFSVQVPRTYGGPEQAPVRMATPVEISIYSVNGQLVRSIARNSSLDEVMTLRWDGTDDRNVPVPSGVYFVRALAGSNKGLRKIVLLR